MMPYERFHAWQAAHALALRIYRATQSFPSHERYGLVSQARRAAFSAAANIAEGSAKRGRREFGRYLDITLGSLSELSYVLRLARDLEILSLDEWHDLDAMRNQAGRLTWGLYDRLRKAKGR